MNALDRLSKNGTLRDFLELIPKTSFKIMLKRQVFYIKFIHVQPDDKIVFYESDANSSYFTRAISIKSSEPATLYKDRIETKELTILL